MNLNYHIILSRYFAGKPLYMDEPTQKKPNTRKLVEQPWQQTKGELWDDVTETICNLDFIQAKAVAKMTYDLVKDFNEVLLVIPENAENIRQEKVRQERMNKYTSDLILYAKGEIAAIEIPESIIPWTKEQTDSEIGRLSTNPSISDFLKDFNNFLKNELSDLHSQAFEIQNYAYQQAWNYANHGPVGKAASEASQEIYQSLFLQTPRPQWNPLPMAILTLREEEVVVSITADGEHAMFANDDTLIKRNLNTGQLIQAFKIPFGTHAPLCTTQNGMLAVAGSSDNKCTIWDLITGKISKTLSGHIKEIVVITTTPDGGKAISGSRDGVCILWDLTTGRALKTLNGHKGYITAISITTDGKKALTSSGGTELFLWDLITGNIIQSYIQKYIDNPDCITISPSGKRTIMVSGIPTCIFWNAKTDEWGYDFDWLRANSIALTQDGNIAIIGVGNDCIVLEIETGHILHTLKGHRAEVTEVSITADGRLGISSSHDKTCILWNLIDGQPIKSLFGHTDNVHSVVMSPDGKIAITSSWDQTCIVWNLQSGYFNQLRQGHNYSNSISSIKSISISMDGQQVLSCSHDSTSIIWDLSSGESHNQINSPSELAAFAIKGLSNFSVFHYTNAERYIKGETSSKDIFYKLKDISSGKMITLCTPPEDIDQIFFTPDRKRAITGSKSKECMLWDLMSCKALFVLKDVSLEPQGFFFSPDGIEALSSSTFHDLIISNLTTGEVSKRYQGMAGKITFTPDGKMAASTYRISDTIIIWNLITGQVKWTLKEHNDIVDGISITPDGRIAISESADTICIVWDLVNGKVMHILKMNSNINKVEISTDGQHFATFLENGSCILWDIKSGNKTFFYRFNSDIWTSILFSNGVFLCSKDGEVKIIKADKKFINGGGSIATIRQIWDFEFDQFQEPISDCPICGHRFPASPFVLNTIEKIAKKAGLKSNQSPCLELPDEAWEEPGLLGNCPNCGERLKFNPFVAGGKTNPKWKFWKR